MHTTELYFEAHVTTDPIELGSKSELMLREAARIYEFRIAEFLYKKTKKVAKIDDFLTSRDKDYEKLEARTQGLVVLLRTMGIKVRRYKIENTLLDVKILD